MAAPPLRRSARARKTIQTYAAEELIEESTAIQPKDAQTLAPTQTDEDNDAYDGDIEVSVIKHEHDDEDKYCHEHMENHHVIVKNEHTPHDSSISIKKETVTERQVIKHNIDEIQPPATKKCRTKEEADSNVQLYGYPPEGTMIPWGITRMRKQPKIFPILPRKNFADLSHALSAERRIERRKSEIPRLKFGEEETRLKDYTGVRPEWYDDFLERASTQKMFVLERQRGYEQDCHANNVDCPEEVVRLAGSKGNVYTVTISHLTSCTCPVTVFSKTGEEKQCKHVFYVLHHVLKAPEHLRYQAAFLTSELKEIFAHAPLLPTTPMSKETEAGTRRSIEGDCPICFTSLEEEGTDDSVVWCKNSCGNNIHKVCFKTWAKSRPGDQTTCPFCRAVWHSSAVVHQHSHVFDMPAEVSRGGYLNVLKHLDYD